MSQGDVADRYGRLVARLDPTMAIVTAAVGGERAGCLVGFHSQCSIDPVRHAVWLSKANRTYRVALFSEHLVVHVVDAPAHDLARHFGGTTGDDIDKFAGIDWHEGPGGVPILDRLPTHLVGRRRAVFDEGGDHSCVILEPVAVGLAPEPWSAPQRLGEMTDISPGHEAEEA